MNKEEMMKQAAIVAQQRIPESDTHQDSFISGASWGISQAMSQYALDKPVLGREEVERLAEKEYPNGIASSIAERYQNKLYREAFIKGLSTCQQSGKGEVKPLQEISDEDGYKLGEIFIDDEGELEITDVDRRFKDLISFYFKSHSIIYRMDVYGDMNSISILIKKMGACGIIAIWNFRYLLKLLITYAVKATKLIKSYGTDNNKPRQ